MVQRKRTYKKRAYKKRTYKRRYYKRRVYKRRYYKPIKKPEIHIVENDTLTGYAFNNTGFGLGKFVNLTTIKSDLVDDIDSVKYEVHPVNSTGSGKLIEGKKIRLKYLYIKGFIKIASTGDADDFNCKLMVFRWKRNTTNASLLWTNLINNTNNIDLNDPSTWTEDQRLDLMYKQDWKNDIKINFYRKIKNLYRKYDDANNVIPFKIRVPLYDCVLTCDAFRDSNGKFAANNHPSTNGLYFTFLSNKYDETTIINYKTKLYYTDY